MNRPANQLIHKADQVIAEYSARDDANPEILAALRRIRDEIAEPWARLPEGVITEEDFRNLAHELRKIIGDDWSRTREILGDGND